MRIGDRLHKIRKDKGLTLKEVQEMLEKKGETISVPYLSEIERNISTPSIKTLEKLAGIYGITLPSLLGDIDLEENESKIDNLPPKSKQAFEEFLKLVEQIGGCPLEDSWKDTLLSVRYRGKAPETTQAWYQLYTAVKLIEE